MLLPPVRDLLLALGVTVVLVTVTGVLGLRGRRRPHVAAALVTAVALFYTIYLAETLGQSLLIPPTVKWTHLAFANAAFVAFLGVVGTGFRLFRAGEARRRAWHRRAVVVFLVATAFATATGTWMLLKSKPRPGVVRAAVLASPLSRLERAQVPADARIRGTLSRMEPPA